MWKDIEGWKNYEVSDCGQIRRKACMITYPQGFQCFYKQRLLKPEILRNGYQRITVSEGNLQKRYMVHRIVAMHFISNPTGKPYVNHIDGNKVNNRASNLEWCTPSENERHSYDVLGKAPSGRSLTDSQADEIRSLKGIMGCRRLGSRFGVHKSTILNIWNNVYYTKAVSNPSR